MGASGRISEQRSPYGERHHLVECQCAECYPSAPPEGNPVRCVTAFSDVPLSIVEWEVVPGCPGING